MMELTNARPHLSFPRSAWECSLGRSSGPSPYTTLERRHLLPRWSVGARDKWLAALGASVQGELDRVSQALTGRIRQLAERYATPLPKLIEEVDTLAAQVDDHLKAMGFTWN